MLSFSNGWVGKKSSTLHQIHLQKEDIFSRWPQGMGPWTQLSLHELDSQLYSIYVELKLITPTQLGDWEMAGFEACPGQRCHQINSLNVIPGCQLPVETGHVFCLSCLNMAAAYWAHNITLSPSMTSFVRKYITENKVCGRFITKLEFTGLVLPSSLPVILTVIMQVCHTYEHRQTWAFHGRDICCPNKMTS